MEGAHSVSLYQSFTLFSSSWNHPRHHFGALMSHYNSYQTISVSCVCVRARVFVCTPVRAGSYCCGLYAHADIRLSPQSFRDSRDLCFCVLVSLPLVLCDCVCGGQWALGYNCIVLPSHSVSTPICLFNIQLSTLDLEASMAAQSHIHTNTSMADFSRGPLK